MPSLYKTLLATAGFAMCFSIAGNAQKLNLQFTGFNVDNGLTSNSVSDVIQDKKGFIWIATGNGLQRFDGLRFTTWRAQLGNPQSINSDIVGKLLEDDDQNLWVACHNGVSRFNQYRQAPERIGIAGSTDEFLFQPVKFFQDSKKNIWLVTRPHGIFWYDEKAKDFVPANNILPKTNWKGFSMEEDPATGDFWVGTDSGLAYIDIKKHQVYTYANNPLKIPVLANPKFYHNAITGIKLDNEKRLWINIFLTDYPRSTKIDYQSFYYNTLNGTVTEFDAPNKTNYDYAIDKENNMWLLGEDIFSVRVGDKFVKVPMEDNDPYGLRAHVVHSFFEDRGHNHWLGTNLGIFIFNPDEVKIGRGAAFNDKKERLNATPQQFLQMPNGKIWMSTWGEGLMEYDMSFNPLRRYKFGSSQDDINFNMIWTMLKASDNRVWFGCQAGKLMVYDPKTTRFQKLSPPELDFRTVRTSVEDKKGNIWFGTQHGLVVKYDTQTSQFTRFAESSYPSKEVWGNINKLMVDDDGVLWACTNGGGVLKFDVNTGKVIESFKHNERDAQSVSSNNTHSILQYNDSIYVISSSMGINFLNVRTRKFEHITTSDGLPTNTAQSLQKDRSNHIWAGLSGALVRISMPSKNVSVMGKKEGVFNEAFQLNALELLSDGRMVAGTTDDFLYFNPDRFRSSSAPSAVQITSFKVFNQEINFDSILQKRKKIILPYNLNFIRLEYSPLGFLNDNLTYYYKLEGLDKDWIRGTGDLSANYANLQGGNYTFKIKSVNGDGISSKEITSLSFYIRSPFWETWWFLFLLAVIAAAALYFAHQSRIKQLVGMEAVRSRIARDLHDDMGSTLSTINILSEMARMKIDKDATVAKSYIVKISDNCSRMMEAMDDIVWSINPMNDNMQRITARMREYATNLLEAKDISYTFQVDEAVKYVKLDMEARRDFFLIFKEAVNNLAKYSECTHAHIKIEVYEYNMCMKIQDDGKGFIVKDADNGNGLTNMAKRAQTLNAKFNIESQPGVGTKILLEVNFA